MSPEELALLRSVEDRHWWCRGLRRMLARAFASVGGADAATILDAGCGPGANTRLLAQLAPLARVIALDLSPVALASLPPHPRITPLHGDANALPLPDAQLDLVFAGDLLGQTGVNASAALAGFHRALRPGGAVLVNVPAFAWLRGEHDRAAHVARRFSRAELRALLTDAGFSVERVRFWNCALLAPLAVRRLLTRDTDHAPTRPPRSDLTATPPALNSVLAAWLAFETGFAARVPLPFGTSLFAVARKPSSPWKNPR